MFTYESPVSNNDRTKNLQNHLTIKYISFKFVFIGFLFLIAYL